MSTFAVNGSFYFGVWDASRAGHHLYTPEGHCICDPPRWFPVAFHALDGGLLPHGSPQVEGISTLVYLNGWSILTFWDRSVDHRMGSCSAFLFKGRLIFEAVCLLARDDFAVIWERFTFPIRLWEIEPPPGRAA